MTNKILLLRRAQTHIMEAISDIRDACPECTAIVENLEFILGQNDSWVNYSNSLEAIIAKMVENENKNT